MPIASPWRTVAADHARCMGIASIAPAGDLPTQNAAPVILAEEEISDVSLAFSLSSTRKTPDHIFPAFSLPEGVDTGVDMGVAAEAVQCTEAAAAAECTEAAAAASEAAQGAAAAAEAAVYGLEASGSARSRCRHEAVTPRRWCDGPAHIQA